MSYRERALAGDFSFENTLDQALEAVNEIEAIRSERIRNEESEAIMWWALDRQPGMDDILEKAGDSLQPMFDQLEIFPFKDRSDDYRIFLAQYKFSSLGLIIAFIAGFQIECVEMLVAIGQYSSLPGDDGEPKVISEKQGLGRKVPPNSGDYFVWPDEEKVLLNKLYKRTRDDNLTTKIFDDGLDGGTKLGKHWWLRVEFAEESARKFPVPGEFIGLGVKIFAGLPWGLQESAPFIYSGNWIDSVYYTSALVKEVYDPSGDIPYPIYLVQWRDQEVTARPSDFAEYAVGDRVTILKAAAAEKTEQTWKDEDTKEFNEEWVIVPMVFYATEEEGG